MFHTAFQPQNRCFSTALLGLGFLLVCTLGLFIVLIVRTCRAEQTLQATRDNLLAQHDLWQAQGIRDYQVRYSNCNPRFCCQHLTLQVRNDIVNDIVPSCVAANLTNVGFAGYSTISTMDGTFRWLYDWMLFNDRRQVKIAYDPNLHYITRLEFTPYDGAKAVVIEYQDLSPLDF